MILQKLSNTYSSSHRTSSNYFTVCHTNDLTGPKIISTSSVPFILDASLNRKVRAIVHYVN